ncbi:MAG TPA: response regulator [Pyrinomonadaceae bacterium]|nr:response regulator [Pyrinomonadaceae bacterium]
MKILIAEDNRVSRRLLEGMLKSWGHTPVLTGDGLEALSVLRADDPPQIAVLDWMMPGIDGIELTRVLREEPGAAAVPLYIIMLTAKASEEDAAMALKAGADDFLSKPFQTDELRARLAVGSRIVDLQTKLTIQV